jgi:Ser/Thr protein kinase RdoA (MazF antagonist)
MLGTILPQYGLDESEYTVKPFGNGLINHSWKIISAGKEFLLQRINQQVFRRPADIMDNCRLLSGYFKIKHPDYLFVAPLHTIHGLNYVQDAENNYYRLFPFIKNSYTCNEVNRPALAYEAAKQFGKFTRLLSDFDPAQLLITLPDFHNLSLRHQQFEQALEGGARQRIEKSRESIRYLKNQSPLVEIFEKIRKGPSFIPRVIHHDAKINNVLFDIGTDQGVCVIDLDTVMPGYYISDVGDMLRTYLSPAGEEEPDFGKMEIREDYFREVAKGYLGEMKSELGEEELLYFVYAGKFGIYMQALRFLTDYLNNDIYYLTRYEDQNLVRANNQVVLLQRYAEKEDRLNSILETVIFGL